jgi:hypothetical protein
MWALKNLLCYITFDAFVNTLKNHLHCWNSSIWTQERSLMWVAFTSLHLIKVAACSSIVVNASVLYSGVCDLNFGQ